jgi:cellulose synthase/poly-beta-1,6-N-acetylglucosamine synthase-like glycosyltransferase
MSAWVCLLSLLFIAYTVAGYPLVLACWARCRARPWRSEAQEPMVTVVLPVRNGQTFLRAKLESIIALDYPRERRQIIVVSDGSADATEAIASSFADQGVELLAMPRRGKAAAINEAVTHARGSILMFTDVRQALEPQTLRALTAPFADEEVGVVSGELWVQGRAPAGALDTQLYRRYENWLRRQLAALDSTFGATGCCYAMRRSLAVKLPDDTLLDDVYLPLAAFFEGYRCVVEPHARAYESPVAEFPRKVRTLAGNYQILAQYPALLTRRNRQRWHFASYKLARLALPFAMLSVALTSPRLPAPWAAPLVAAQLALYGMAALYPWLPPSSAWRSLTAPAHGVVTMMVAALLALRIFVVSPRHLWQAP